MGKIFFNFNAYRIRMLCNINIPPLLTDRNCHFGIFAVLGQNSVFSPNYDFLQPEQLIQSQLTTDPITIFRQRRLGEV